MLRTVPATATQAGPGLGGESAGLSGMGPTRRPSVRGKFFDLGNNETLIKGVTYGPFRPEADGGEYHTPDVVDSDFELMRRAGVNAVRTYTVPPRWLFNLAERHHLKLMIGLPWEQHVTFLDSPGTAQRIERSIRNSVREMAGHPAILCYTIGNEIPSSIVRWHGGRDVSRFLARLCRACKLEDPAGLVTYANYPSTEYLDLSFCDFLSFNVYVEKQPALEAYLARLHNLAGDRPLVVSELGLDAHRNGNEKQAQAIDWQVRASFASGCAGAFVFSWTDEWFRGGQEIVDWKFGLTTREREPRASFERLKGAFAESPFPPEAEWPRISVVVCTYNGSRTLRECLAGIAQLDYPNFETIVVDDGSSDSSAQIASEFSVRLIRTPNRGLSSARNTAMRAATGEIVAYIDDDAWPDPRWLKFLAAAFRKTDHVGIGGPNIPPGDDGFRANCVAHSPGGPMHVLMTDTVAEHLPGCNMAFRKSALEEVDGFDEAFRIAGDDVDLCWRLQARGWTLGFSPAAMVWHHRRGRLRDYWKQQRNYGRAEAMLERKWPEKYNALGHATWSGRLYGKGLLWSLAAAPTRIYHGRWGSALFQSVYQSAPGSLASLPATPEWYLITCTLGALCGWGVVWNPLLWLLPVFAFFLGTTIAQSVRAAIAAFPSARPMRARFSHRVVTTYLHFIQPIARLRGRLKTGLTPWRRRGPAGIALPIPRRRSLWVLKWRSLEDELCKLESSLQESDAVVSRGGDFDNWDLEVRGGILGSVRLRATVEEHGDNKQMFRLRCWPVLAKVPAALLLLLIIVWDVAAITQAWSSWLVAGVILACAIAMVARELGLGMAAVLGATRDWKREGRF